MKKIKNKMQYNILLLCQLINALSMKNGTNERALDFTKVYNMDNYDDSIFTSKFSLHRRQDENGNGDGGNDVKGWAGLDNQYSSENRNKETNDKKTAFNPKLILQKNLNTIRLRPDIYSLSAESKMRLVEVFKELNLGPKPTIWDQFTKLHILSYQYVHLQPYFLVWHRAFIYRLEESMLAINNTVSLPYWDWTTYNTHKEEVDPIFADDFFGGNGNPQFGYCMTTGAFKIHTPAQGIDPKNDFTILYDHDHAHDKFVEILDKQTKNKLSPMEINYLVDDDKDLRTPNKPKCLRRKFREKNAGYMGWNSREKMDSVISNRNPIEFWHFVERGGHGFVHNTVGSERATDPLFFVLHGFVDKIWFDWQNRNPDLAFKYPVKAEHLDMVLNPFGVTVRELLDPINNMGYGYSQQRYGWSGNQNI